MSANENRIPQSIQKELDRRRIGNSITNIANNFRRNNSWDQQQQRIKTSGSGDSIGSNSGKRVPSSPNKLME